MYVCIRKDFFLVSYLWGTMFRGRGYNLQFVENKNHYNYMGCLHKSWKHNLSLCE